MALPGIYDAFQHWSKQTVWIYSDPHFGDKDLECGVRNRPSSEEQIANINSCAGRCDTLIILGDIGDIECVRKLRAGYKVLIMGNHDSGASNYKRQVIQKMFGQEEYTREQVIAEMRAVYPGWKISVSEAWDPVRAPFKFWFVEADNMLFDEVYEGALIVGEKLILSHEPLDMIPWAFNIHGHQHNKRVKNGPRHLNVCADVIGYKPFHLTHFLQKCGPTANIDSLHRETIDRATERKAKRGGKKIAAARSADR